MIRLVGVRAEQHPAVGAERLAELVREARCTVALTGAGISVPSGIPDFRTPETGLWADVDPMEVAHIDVFERDPERFWSYYRPRFHSLGDKQPNAAHEALAELERRGLLAGVITQNIDRLHRAAGSREVVEVHGSIETSTCRECDVSYGLADVDALFDAEGIARCVACGGAVKPDVVLFGELLPEAVMRRAQALAAEADLMLCVGSSLVVHPVAGLPEVTLATGGRLAIVTKSATPYDDVTALKLDGEVDEELAALLAALETVNEGSRVVSREEQLDRGATLIRSAELDLISPAELEEQRRPG
jgi:NAD-dependent deacetylase